MVKFKENVLCLIQFTTCDKQTWNRTPEVQQSCYHFQLSNLCTKKSFTIYFRYICYQMKEMSVLVLNLVDRRSNSHDCMMGDICELSYGKWDIVGAKQNKIIAFAPYCHLMLHYSQQVTWFNIPHSSALPSKATVQNLMLFQDN